MHILYTTKRQKQTLLFIFATQTDILGARKPTRYISTAIPCKRYLAKFAASVYGHPIKADTSTMIGQFIQLCLDKNTYDNRHSSEAKKNLYEAKLNISINEWQFNGIGYNIAPEKAIAINSFIEKIFTEHLYQWCYVRTKKNCRFKGVDEQIRSFAAHHNIVLDDDQEDISFDALKKKEYRFRLNLIKHHNEYRKLFFADLSPRKIKPQQSAFCVLSGMDRMAEFAEKSTLCSVEPAKRHP